MFANFFKPKWQHKDAKVRLQAVSTLSGNSNELLQLAQHDPDAEVQSAALSRISDLPILLALGKRSDSVGEKARARTLIVATTDYSADAQLLEVFSWLEQSPALVKSIALEPKRLLELRKLALPYLQEPDRLFRLAEEDESREMQYLAAERIQDLEQLKKLDKRHGNNNKRLRQLVKERLGVEEQRQKQRQEYEQCCTQLEALGQQEQRWEQDKTQLLILQRRWQQYAASQGKLPEALQQRFQAAESAFLTKLDAYQNRAAELAPTKAGFERLLAELQQLTTQLETSPADLTLSQIDQTLQKNRQQWQSLPMLPVEYQAYFNEEWENELERIRHLRATFADDLKALDELQALLQQAEYYKTDRRPLQVSKILALQSAWAGASRPHTLRERTGEMETQFQQALQALNSRLSQEAKQREQNTEALYAELTQVEQQLEEQQYSHAIEAYHALQQRLKHTPDLADKDTKQLRERLQGLAPMMREFEDWRRWGTDQAREHLIESAEHLGESEIDPLERAKRIRTMRDEWRKLVTLDPGHQHKQWKEFDQKVSAAYEPSKQYFAEQARLRQEHLQERGAICQNLEELAQQTNWQQADLDWRGINQHINQQRKLWKQAGTVGHKDWVDINERFNAAIDALELHLQQERERNWTLRSELVAEVDKLVQEEDLSAAADKAKQLQAAWYITIPSRQGDEQRLWKAFRAPMDTIFTRLKEERDSERSEQHEHIQQKENLCVEMESLVALPMEEFVVGAQKQAELNEAFHAIRDLPHAVHKRLEERWRLAQQGFKAKQEQAYWYRQWQQLDNLAAEQTTVAVSGTDIEGERLCLELEILLELPTPEAFQAKRRTYQLERMSESMTGGRSKPEDKPNQALRLLRQWYGLKLSNEAKTSQQARVQAVREYLQGQVV